MKWYQSRLFNYVIFGLIYVIMNDIIGFELTVLIALGNIIGEQTVISYKKRDNQKNLKLK